MLIIYMGCFRERLVINLVWLFLFFSKIKITIVPNSWIPITFVITNAKINVLLDPQI